MVYIQLYSLTSVNLTFKLIHYNAVVKTLQHGYNIHVLIFIFIFGRLVFVEVPPGGDKLQQYILMNPFRCIISI